jgi:uncharacterized membrane protein
MESIGWEIFFRLRAQHSFSMLMSEVVQTDWSIEEAMSFVMTGGTNSPESIRFFKEEGGKTG